MWAHRIGSRWKGVCVTYSSALISISLDMSLLNVSFSRFPQVLSSPITFVGSGQNPCASAHWSGMSDRWANPTQNTETEMLINCHMWTTSPQTQILLKASHSCTSVKTTKQWPRWSLMAEVRRWDTCSEPTNLRSIGCLTESTWSPKSKSNTLIPKTNSQTCWRKAMSFVMNGITFSVCSTSWTFWSFLVAISVQLTNLKLGSCATHSLVTLKVQSSNLDLTSTGRPVARGLNENTASSSEVWQTDVNPSTGTGRPVAETTKNPMRISRHKVGHLEKDYSNVRQKLGRQPRDDMPDIDVNAMIWRIFMSKGRDTSWTTLSGESTYHQEHRLRTY